MGRDVSGHVVFTTSCHLIAPCVIAPGSLTVTSKALFFTVDEENSDYQKLDPKVSSVHCGYEFFPLTFDEFMSTDSTFFCIGSTWP